MNMVIMFTLFNILILYLNYNRIKCIIKENIILENIYVEREINNF